MPETVAVPTVVPPLAQLLGALAWGPNTLNVIVPPAPLPAPDSDAVIELDEMATPVLSDAGPPAEVDVTYCTFAPETKPVAAVHELYVAVIVYS